MADRVRFAEMADGTEVAYRAISGGDGPVIVHSTVGPWPLDLLGEEPMYDRFLRTLSGYGRLVIYDRPGLGSSDPFDRHRDWLEQMSEACVTVLDAVGSQRAWLVGSALPEYATTIRVHPERVLGAVLINPLSTARFRRIVDSSVERDRSATMEPQPSRAGDRGFAEWLERANRLGASAADRAEFMSAQATAVDRFFAEPEPILDGPPTMLIRRRDAMTDEEMEWWADIFRGAECVTVEGADSGVMGLDAGLIAELAASFVTGTSVAASTDRRLVAVLFTDLVGSTPIAAASGDAVWTATLDRYEASLYTTIQRHHGVLVKHTGDGAVATFPSGSEAISAAIELRSATRDLGLEGRTGIHVGEIEQRGEDIGGIAVHLAARVMGQADPGGIVATAAVNDTTQGGRYNFEDIGMRTLKGIDEPCHLFLIEDITAR